LSLPSPTWTPRDYLLHGRYCETDTIAAVLRTIRQRAGAEAAVLLAFRQRRLFHSLLLIDHRQPDLQRQFEEVISHRPPYVAGSGDPPFVQFDPLRDPAAQLIDALVAHSPFNEISDLFASECTVVGAREQRTTDGNDHQLEPAGVLVILVGLADLSIAELDTDLSELLCMVNASAPVVVHGNLAAERDVERAMEELEEWASGLVDAPLGQLPRKVLDVALDLTGSSLGNIYFDSREGDLLELEAAALNDKPLQSIAVDDPDSVVAWVYSRRRPMVINDIRDFRRMYPSGYISVAGDEVRPYAELAVPIVQTSLGPGGGTVVGVINVEKVRPLDTGYYTYRDLTVLRLTASRLSLWRAQRLHSHFSRSLAGLTRSAIGLSPFTDERPRQIGPGQIPADAWGAKTVIDQTLRVVYDLTRSQSATVRLLTPDRRSLVRFSAFPSDRLSDEFAVITVKERRSVNAWVAREGRQCHLRNTRQDKAVAEYKGLDGYLDARPKTRSELCLPIFVSGRIVGTLNLESQHQDGYANTHDLAQAVVEQVGLALEHARRAEEQTVFSMSLATTANSHELLKAIGHLRAGPRDRAALRALADRMEGLIDTEAQRQAPREATTSEIVSQVLADLNFQSVFPARTPPPFDIHHSGLETLILQVVLTELFRNAHAAALNVSLKCSLQWHATHVGGRSYLTLHVANPIRYSVAPTTADVLFRSPVRYQGSRLHIGAFTAAALVRSLGGDIYVNRNDPPLFVVGVDLPAGASQPGWSDKVA
jgi:GAF domain